MQTLSLKEMLRDCVTQALQENNSEFQEHAVILI